VKASAATLGGDVRTTPHALPALALIATAGVCAPLGAQTREFLDAPTVRTQIRIRWNVTTKKLAYAIDDSTVFEDLPDRKLFLTRTAIFITYYQINPLRVQAAASATVLDDPAQQTIAKLIDAITGVATLVGSRAASLAAAGTAAQLIMQQPTRACPGLDVAQTRISRLTETLYSGKTTPAAIRDEIDGWVGAVDSGYAANLDGRTAVDAAVMLISQFVGGITSNIATATTAIKQIEQEAATQPATGDACSVAVNTAYQLALLANPRARLEQLQAVNRAARDLQAELARSYVSNHERWIDRVNYKIGPEVRPTADKQRDVVVKVANVSFDVGGTAAVSFSLLSRDVGSAAFTVRRYSPLAVEIGTGAVFAFLKQPEYGTSTNAQGQTIVTRIPSSRFNVTATVLVNFVCRWRTGPFTAPMFQVGASASKQAPALLAGGGLRLFSVGNGDAAVGAGVMVGWVKDLQKLKEGDVVGGTADIEGDKAFALRTSGYVVVQYKF
jgi:hypothetical protein